MGIKKCSKCGEWKDESEFAWHFVGIKRHSACSACRSKYQSEYYQRTKERQLNYKAGRQVDKREEARHYVFQYLKTHPCEMCGESDPYVLTFHHVKGKKKMNISQMVNQGYSIEAIQAEIDLCIVLCSNDHLRVEKKKRGTFYWIF
jgi:ArsR family metal-binding transcriptional regulator